MPRVDVMRYGWRRGMDNLLHSYDVTRDVSNRAPTDPANPGLHQGHALSS